MRMSISTTSGWRALARAAASWPSAASPTTSRSSLASRRARKPLRTRAWSSAITTRITLGLHGKPGRDPEASLGTGAGLEAAAERRRSLSHAVDPRTVADADSAVGRRNRGEIRAAGVDDLDQDNIGPVADPDRHGCSGSVAGDVGQGFLDDPVGSEVGGSGERDRRSGRLEGDVEPNGPGESDQ